MPERTWSCDSCGLRITRWQVSEWPEVERIICLWCERQLEEGTVSAAMWEERVDVAYELGYIEGVRDGIKDQPPTLCGELGGCVFPRGHTGSHLTH